MEVASATMGQKPRCPDCNRPLTVLYRQRRDAEGKLFTPKAPWVECEPCTRIFPATGD